MNARRIAALLALAAVLALAGCGTARTGGLSGTPSAGGKEPAGESAPLYLAQEPATIAAASANEKAAVKNIGKAYASYVKMNRLSNEQNKTDTYIYDAKAAGTSPRLVAYEVSAWKETSPGKYLTLTTGMLVFLGGRVTTGGWWEYAAPVDKDDFDDNAKLAMESSYLFVTPLVPESDGEKAAVASVKAWLQENAPELGLDRVELTGYSFLWGKSTDPANLLLTIDPAGGRYSGAGRIPTGK